jgi:hypothetical protein
LPDLQASSLVVDGENQTATGAAALLSMPTAAGRRVPIAGVDAQKQRNIISD